jgi:hypothetical protein
MLGGYLLACLLAEERVHILLDEFPVKLVVAVILCTIGPFTLLGLYVLRREKKIDPEIYEARIRGIKNSLIWDDPNAKIDMYEEIKKIKQKRKTK